MRNREQRTKVMQAFGNSRGLGISWYGIAREVVRETSFQTRRLANRLASPGAGGQAKQFTDLSDIGAGYDQLVQIITQRGIRLQLPSLK